MDNISFHVKDTGGSAIDAAKVSARLGKFASEVVLDYTYTSYGSVSKEASVFSSLPSNVFGIRRAAHRVAAEKEVSVHSAYFNGDASIEVDPSVVSFEDSNSAFSWSDFYASFGEGKRPLFVRAVDRVLGAPFFLSLVESQVDSEVNIFIPRSSQSVLPVGYRAQKRSEEISDLFGPVSSVYSALKKARVLVQTGRYDSSLGCLTVYSYEDYLKSGIAYDYVLLLSHLYSKLGYVQAFIEAISRFHEVIESSRALCIRAGNFYFGAYQKTEDPDHFDLSEYWYKRSSESFLAEEDGNSTLSNHYKDLGRSKANELLMFARGYQ